jgi:hypothetical protein
MPNELPPSYEETLVMYGTTNEVKIKVNDEKDGMNELQWAIYHGNQLHVTLLLNSGESATAMSYVDLKKSKVYGPPMHTSILYSRLVIMSELLKRGAKITDINPMTGGNVFHCALSDCMPDGLATLRTLWELAGDSGISMLLQSNKEGETPLFVASKKTDIYSKYSEVESHRKMQGQYKWCLDACGSAMMSPASMFSLVRMYACEHNWNSTKEAQELTKIGNDSPDRVFERLKSKDKGGLHFDNDLEEFLISCFTELSRDWAEAKHFRHMEFNIFRETHSLRVNTRDPCIAQVIRQFVLKMEKMQGKQNSILRFHLQRGQGIAGQHYLRDADVSSLIVRSIDTIRPVKFEIEVIDTTCQCTLL